MSHENRTPLHGVLGITQMLEEMGLQVICVDGGAAAIAWANRQVFDLILMDCQMPLVDGLEARRRIREHEQARGV